MSTIQDALTQAQALVATLQGLSGTSTTPPPATTPPEPPAVPQYVIPSECAGRGKILTPIEWRSGVRYYSAAALSDSNVWVMPFTPGAFGSARLAGGDWIDGRRGRLYQLIRNRDGKVLYAGPNYGVPTPSLVITTGVKLGQVTVAANEDYTLAIWNMADEAPGRMFMDLYFPV